MNSASFRLAPGGCLRTRDRRARSATTASRATCTTTAVSCWQVQRAVGTSIQQNYATYTYTPNGKQQTVKDANGNLTTYEYDGLDRM